MMFMMPTPPTTSEIGGHDEQQIRHQLGGRSHCLGHLGHVADVEVVGLPSLSGRMRCRSRSKSVIWSMASGICVGGRLGVDLVHADEADRLGVSAA